MKYAVLAALLALTGLAAAEAQQSGKSVVPGPGSTPAAQYHWVVINGAPTGQNSVAILHSDGSPVLDAAGFPVYVTGNGLNAPYDIVGSTTLHRVFVSNSNAPTVSVFDSDTLQPVGVVNLPTGTAMRGMSLSEDESWVFVAGADVAGPAVWRINTATLATDTAPIGAIPDSTHIAEDCVVIRAGNVGGTGNGPGKVYFSVQTSGTLAPAPGYIGIVNVMTLPAAPPFPAPASIQTQAGPNLNSVNRPTNMERTGDHRFVFVACSKVTGFGSDVRIIQINPLTDVATAPVVALSSQDLATNRVVDVTWHLTSGGSNRGWAIENSAPAGLSIREIDETGAASSAGPANNGVTTAQTIRFSLVTGQVFIGDIPATGNGYAFYDAANNPIVPTPPAPAPVAPTGVGSGCLNVIAMPAPSVVVTDICPRGALVAASMLMTVHGGGFTTGSKADIGGIAAPTTFLDSNTLLVDMAGPAATVGIRVTNPNFQSSSMVSFFRRYTPEQRLPFTIGLPSVSTGYQMLSFPQYATLTNFKAALTAALGPYNPIVYRVFFYRGGTYVELNTLADDGCDLAGESFWVLTRNGATLTLSEPDVRGNDGGSDRVIPINPGFNMISLPTVNGSFPLSGSINWANVLVTTDPANLAAAVPVNGGTIVQNAALEYVGGGYVSADPLVAGRGYWVQNLTTGPAYLIFPRAAVFKPASGARAPGGPVPAGMTPPPPPSGMSSGASSSSSGGCGLLGLDAVLALAFLRRRARRRLAA